MVFQDVNESQNKSDDEDEVDFTEVGFSESWFKHAEHVHEKSLFLGEEEYDDTCSY